MSDFELIHGDCMAALRELPDACVDSIVTDPPAGISFMGKAWDGDKGGRKQWTAWLAGVAAECLRVLKPGGHALVWALPRTSHWTATALEDAGFEVRDCLTHLFGTGFPKSLDFATETVRDENGHKYDRTRAEFIGTPYADGGWGTALKPASEHWWLVRKPLVGTVAANVLGWGTGALNVDGCRIGDGGQLKWEQPRDMGYHGGSDAGAVAATSSALGRWPANVILDPEAAAMLDEQSGDRGGGYGVRGKGSLEGRTSYAMPGQGQVVGYGDSGGASRFFYVAKPSTKEREAGTEGLPRKAAAELVDREEGSAGMGPRAGAGRTSKGRANHHPTVKSIALMRWLVRLITPPGGLVLDPFCGSGTTGCACVLEGFSFIGIEQDAEYVRIADARITHWKKAA